MYESGAIGKTALSYDAYMEIKKHLLLIARQKQPNH